MELKALPEGLASDALPKPVADLAEREGQREHLGDALDGERRIAVAAGCDVAFHVDHREAERLGIDACKLGNVGRDRSAIRPLPHGIDDLAHDGVQIGHRRSLLAVVLQRLP
jgi:hypothetical protein